MTSVPVDMELKKAFTELQQKMVESNQKIKFSEAQIEGLKRSVLHKQLTEKEMSALVPETKVYNSVGRCFMASTIPEIKENLSKSTKELQEKIKLHEANKEFMERDIKNSENSLRELIMQKKNGS